MNRLEHFAIVKSTLAKWLPPGTEVDLNRAAEAIVNRVEFKIEMDMEMAGQGVVDLDQIRDIKTPEVLKPSGMDFLRPNSDMDRLKPPPIGEGSSLILDPSESTDRQKAPNTPIRPSLPGAPKEDANAPKRYWKMEGLRDYIFANTPEDIRVQPQGRRQPIVLVRNINMMFGVDLVKLIYQIGSEYSPALSPSNLDGRDLPAMAIDTPVFVNFSCYDRDQDVNGKMDEIYKQAEAVYRPKPEHIESSAPRISGPLRYDERDPHDTTDPIPSPSTGLVY